jgi:hypothetical protein
MIAKTALLAWCAGRIFGSTLYGWILLGWGVALIDVHTYGASHSLFASSDLVGLTYTIVSAQASFLILWSILAKTAAAWRIASGMVATTIIIFHASLLGGYRVGDSILLMRTVAIVILAALCIALRVAEFRLELVESPATVSVGRRDVFQFGLQHMLIWTTALPPLLLVVKGMDLLIVRRLGVPDMFPAALISSCIAFVSLAAIWFGVGRGNVIWRLAFFAFAIVISGLTMYVQSSQLVTFYGQWPSPPIVRATVLIGDRWVQWFALVGGLLASLLAFLAAAGYRLRRTRRAASPEKGNAVVRPR